MLTSDRLLACVAGVERGWRGKENDPYSPANLLFFMFTVRKVGTLRVTWVGG